MAIILGIDLGTQSLKAMLLDTDRGPLDIESEAYEISIPKPGWAEEDPNRWWSALKSVLARMKLAQPTAFAAIESIGFSGQMHGFVALDAEERPVYPAIIWVDQRSKRQVEEIESAYSFEELARTMHNHVFTGFGLPSLLWLKQELPEVFARIHRICAPKDYLRLLLIGGEAETETSDASSMTGFDFTHRDWNRDVLERFGLPAELFPTCHEAIQVAGTVSRSAAEETGLPEGARVVYGSGDQAAVLLGCGLYEEGKALVNIGTGATYNCYSQKDVYDARLRVQEFCNAIARSYILCGAILSGGLCMSWMKNRVLGIENYDAVNQYAREVPAGSEGLIFLPYLGGERAPHMDFNASGVFFGLRHIHDRRYFCRAVMEGVAMALKDCDALMSDNGINCRTIIASGGGAKSPVWMQILADVLEKEVVITAVEEEASLGACILAGIGTGIFASAADACDRFVRLRNERYEPIAENAAHYAQTYEMYRALYPQLKDLMQKNAR